jgi:carotenoid cleavage dioxygenase-like enzyme
VVELPPFGFFHMGDAWEERDGTIRFDVCTYADMNFAGSGARDLLNGAYRGGGQAGLTLAVLPPTGRGRLERIRTSAEFPRSDPRRAGLSRRFSLHTSGSAADRPMSTGWGVTDLQTGRTSRFDFGAGHIADEMVLIPKARSDKEDQAWLLGPTINLKAGVTELHVFDMARLDDGPVATWAADVAMPASFHGRWKPA